ncbi:MAG: type VI secretion system tube protein Hcp [Alphaproteobacteria bacterium]|nr:type VI secretion system tube protein Hcp [Alphaproteobacteria bacterium]
MTLRTASQALSEGTNNANLYINIAGQGTGTLTGDQVDAKLAKADRLLTFEESMSRDVNASAENTLFSGGAVTASKVRIEVQRTKASLFAQKSFISANNITPINIYRCDLINGKHTVTEQIEYTNCIITSVKTSADATKINSLDTLVIEFRFTQRQDTLFFFDQDGKPQGQDVSLINFPLGTLQSSGGGEGGGGEGGGGGDAGGGDSV